MRVSLDVNVLDAARARVAWAFDAFERAYVAFSGGKDSTVMLHIVADEAIRRGRKFGVMFVDLEAQYALTIDHIDRCFKMYDGVIDPFWVSLPIHLRNAVSQYEPQWVAWEPGREKDWVRNPPSIAITDQARFPFYRYRMEFEEFVPEFGKWYGNGKPTACFVGIRTQESINRWRTIAGHGRKHGDRNWTNFVDGDVWNVYPIYDWSTEDLWTYHAKTSKPHNALYDQMHKAGLTIHQMRICQPYGDDQRKGLWLFHIIEPQTWGRIVARVNGANQGAIYIQEKGNILGQSKISKPTGHSWQSFVHLLLDSMPNRTSQHYQNKIAVFVKWWTDRGYVGGIPDEMPHDQEASRAVPSWRRVCKALLRNDYWCKGLSFGQHRTGAYSKYCEIMKNKRQQWKLVW